MTDVDWWYLMMVNDITSGQVILTEDNDETHGWKGQFLHVTTALTDTQVLRECDTTRDFCHEQKQQAVAKKALEVARKNMDFSEPVLEDWSPNLERSSSSGFPVARNFALWYQLLSSSGGWNSRPASAWAERGRVQCSLAARCPASKT